LDVAVAHYDWRMEPYSLVYDVLREAPAALATELQPRTRQFETLVKQRTRGFVGREFIFQAIDKAIGDPDFPSGYVIVSGEPGIRAGPDDGPTACSCRRPCRRESTSS